VKDVWRLGNLLRCCKGTRDDFPRFIPNIHCRVPQIGWLQTSMPLGEALPRGGLGVYEQRRLGSMNVGFAETGGD